LSNSKPNIILVLLDGARWDRLDKSPQFTQLKKEGFLFDNVSAAYPYTFAEMNTIFTGLFGKENGVDAYYKMFRLKKSIDYLPEILKNDGYFTSCDLISEKVISSRGFDVYQSHDEYVDDVLLKHTSLIKDSFSNSENKPFFTFLQFSKIHTATVSEILKKFEWDDPIFYENSKENLKIYDDAFIQSGIYAQKIFNTIKELGIENNTYVIFFADHGTGNGERFGERNYGVFLYEETVRTFYLFIGPKIEKNMKSSKLFSVTQIFPTLLDISQSDVSLFSNSLLRSIISQNANFPDMEFTFSETGGLQGPYPSPMKPNVFCIKNLNFKLIYYETPDEFELFNIIDDPLEKNNIFDTGLEIEELLKTKLFEWKNR
tara:strand:- start:1539 stop:2657 length:1119 start_codon:yes stop_codon:yes gene_type:complete